MPCDVGVAMGEALLSYSFPSPHPFTQERAKRFWEKLDEQDILVRILKPEKAGRELLELFHDKRQIEFVAKMSRSGHGFLDRGDTPAFPGVFEAAQFAVGSTVRCLKEVVEGRLDHAFNPVGGLHHATRDSSAGFCVFNDVGVAVELLRRQYAIRRVLYADIDVHHGDGVFYSYETDPDLYVFDMHEDGRYLYPGTGFESERGKGKAEGTKVNVPLPPGAGDEEAAANIYKLKELVDSSSPEFIILQCGADGLAGDPIAGLRYTSETHRVVTELLHSAAHKACKGRILALGGGGYDPENCASAWVTVVKTLTNVS
ncbi:MAG: acetoin utilization protein AcuC [Thaumarchaeota archaeon]|nr:acetoin utilization protein AcuC [Nitrososphaerota archaeon]